LIFITISSGAYTVGSAQSIDNPIRKIRLKQYHIASVETTNAEFKKFVEFTGYVTDAERLHNAMVFEPPLKEFRWIQDKTANWRYPNGKTRGGISDKLNHPVTTISYHDATAYCKWAKARLPTLDEWEVACRAGTKGDYFFSEPTDIVKFANIWHKKNHLESDTTDGFMTTSPVGSFAPNPWGLYDVYGNVFEFCEGRLNSDTSKNQVHARGGSWWCSKNSCCFFNSVDIGRQNKFASFSNQGFRTVKN
jgi:formylglycine-generating enzyme